jgi:hypothetical protein
MNEQLAIDRAQTGYDEARQMVRQSGQDSPYTAQALSLIERGAALNPYGEEAAGIYRGAIGPHADYTSGTDLLRSGARGFDEAWQAGSLDPYMENLAGPLITEANRDYMAALNQQRANEVLTGAFGGGRTGIAEGTLTGRHMENLRDIRGGAFDRALGTFAQDQARRLQAGGALSSLGQAEQQRRLQAGGALLGIGESDAARALAGGQTLSALDEAASRRSLAAGATMGNLNAQQIRDLATTGEVDRIVRQAADDFDYGQFLEARDWDVNNLGVLLQTLGAVPKDVTATTDATNVTESVEQSGMLGQLLGAGVAIAGAFFTGGMSLAAGAGATAAGAGGSQPRPALSPMEIGYAPSPYPGALLDPQLRSGVNP